ncbi:hypothetical protein ACHWQZ_G002829 [Mnemiopsis leidyi]
MGKRKNNVAPSQNFVVEKVLDRYIDELGNKWFYLKWLGYPEDQSTWEPEQNVDCTGLIREFERKFNKKVPKKSPVSSKDSEWSLKQATGSSTKIVLKKINLENIESCPNEPSNQTCSIKLKLNGDCYQSAVPQRKNKRRRSSAIGVEVGTPKKKRAGGRRKKTESEEAVVPLGSTEEYMVESIQDKCLDANGRILYLIKWIGYDSIYNTWEPVENLNCPEILHEFNAKNKHPKVIVSKILDKRKTDGSVEYLVKISGCRKQTWMLESELQCSDLLMQFNKEYDARNCKISLADIADDCSSSEEEEEEEPKSVTGGIKVNRNCTTSSDEDTFSPIVHKKDTPRLNGSHPKVKTKSRSSSSSSTDSNLDFEDLLKRYNESVKKDNPLDSAPPSPPTPEEVIPSFSIKKEDDAETSVSPKSEPQTVKPVVNKSPRTISKKLSPKPLVHKSPQSDNDDDKDPLLNIPVPKFDLPQLIIPKNDKVFLRKSPLKYSPKTSSPSPRAISPPIPSPKPLKSPVCNYPGTLTSDRGRDLSKEPPKTESTVPLTLPPSAPLASYMKPLRSASDDSDSDESLSELESKLTEALKGDNSDDTPSEVPLVPKAETTEPKSESSFSGVDLGALIFTETEKSVDTSLNMSGLLDSIVSQTVTNSLQSAFMDTSVTDKDLSHSELFEVVAQHTVAQQHPAPQAPSEKEIDNVLGELYATAAGTEVKKGEERKSYFPEPVLENDEEEEEEMEPLDPPLNNIVGPDREDSPSPPPPAKPIPPPPAPVISPFQDMLSTFTSKPTRKPKKTVLSVRTFSKKTPIATKIKEPVSNPADDIFSDMCVSSLGSKRNIAANNVPCPYCSRKFKDKSKLDFHISFKHPQMLELACDNCGNFFQSAIEYQCHQLTCSKEND